MIERYEELRGYLPGLQKDMPECYGKLAEIFEHQVFELHLGEERGRKTDFYIPYMMNDALECYLVLRDAWMTGDYLELDPNIPYRDSLPGGTISLPLLSNRERKMYSPYGSRS